MVSRIDGYWMEVIAPIFFFQEFTLDPLPPGTNVYASISLSDVNTLFAGNTPDPTFVATAYIESWTFYQPDGTESDPQTGNLLFNQNAVWVENCARIKFALFRERVVASAQINVFTF